MKEKQCFDDQWIVVTGGAGFIGSCIVRQLNHLGYEKNIIIVDDLDCTEKWKNLQGKHYNELISHCELIEWLYDNQNDVEAIIHMGAITDTVGINGDDYYKMNYRYSIELAKFALEYDIRFIYASSAATYGHGENGFDDDQDKLDSLVPVNLYGQTKHMFDLWAYRNNFLDHIVGLKFFNVYGPGERYKGRMASMIYHMYNQIKEEKKVKLFESNDKKYQNGGQERDFIYVKDIEKIVCDFLFNDITGIFNVGTGIAKSWNSVANEIFSVLGITPNIKYIPMPNEIKKSYQNYTCANMSNLGSLMKLHKTSLEDGINDYIKNYLINE